MSLFFVLLMELPALIVLAVCWAVAGGQWRYAHGMVYGMHVPEYALQQPELTDLLARSRKAWRVFQWGNLILCLALCLAAFWGIIPYIMLWLLWLLEYIVGLELLTIRPLRAVYRLKCSNGWCKEGDDDEYWKTGWYANPNDPHLIVPNRLQATNGSFNMARPAARWLVGGITAFVAISMVWTVAVLLPFANVEVNFQKTGSTMQFSAAAYRTEFTADDIQSAELLDTMPQEGLVKINGGAMDNYRIGKYIGSKSGDCRLYLNGDALPVIKIVTPEYTIYANAPDAATAKAWYAQITAAQAP